MVEFIVTSIIFILLIYIGHMAWNYIVHTYSKPKIRDTIQHHIDKYKKIATELKADYISSEEKESMKHSLLEFAQQQCGSTNDITETV
jgi:hypothetical protein